MREPSKTRNGFRMKQAAKFSMAPVILASQLAIFICSFFESPARHRPLDPAHGFILEATADVEQRLCQLTDPIRVGISH